MSAEAAKEHADDEYQKWRASRAALPEPVDADFEEAVRGAHIIEKERPRIEKKEDE